MQAVVDALVSKRALRRQKEQEEQGGGVTARGKAGGGTRTAHADGALASKQMRVHEDT